MAANSAPDGPAPPERAVEPGRAPHWDGVYRAKRVDEVSWYRPHLDLSMRLLQQAGLSASSRLIDVGGGASTLVDDLLDYGVRDVTILDISSASLQQARQRLGERAAGVQWLAADVRQVTLPPERFDLWHDRAALHFLVDPLDARAYAALAHRAIAAGGHALIAGFAADGPERCSQLPVVRREPADIAALFGPAFELVGARHERHHTPSGHLQSFAYALLRKR